MKKGPYSKSPWQGSHINGASFTIGDETNDVINVVIQLKDGTANQSGIRHIQAYLSDNDDGSTIAGTAPDGGVAIGSEGLAIPLIAGKAFTLVTNADGEVDLDIEESGADTWYLVLLLPDGSILVSDALTFAA